MKKLLEPWKNFTDAKEYLEKTEVSWTTVGLTFVAMLILTVLLSAVSFTAAEGAGLLLSLYFMMLVGMSGISLFIKARRKQNDDIKIGIGRYFRYLFVTLFGFVVISSTLGVLGQLLGGALSTLVFFITNLGVFVLMVYVPYKTFNLTKRQGLFVGFLAIYPPSWQIGTIYLIYWWVRYGRTKKKKAIKRSTELSKKSKPKAKKKVLKRGQD